MHTIKRNVLFLQTVSENREMADLTEKTIDIEKILKSKMGPKAKFVPGFLVNWLKRIAHQDQVNAYLWDSRDKVGVEWLEDCMHYLDTTLEIEGKENLPDPNDGRLYTFVSNHPLGGEDGVALGAIIGRHYDGRFRYLVNDLLMNLPGLAPLCIPINKTGHQSRNFPAMVEAGFQSQNHMLMFPAGLCSRKKDGVISDIPWTKTFISKSVQYQRDVVPIHFGGQNSNFFYPRHALPRRRDVQERPQDLPRGHRQAHPLADLRQIAHAQGMGPVRPLGSI